VNTFIRTDAFAKWLGKLAEATAAARILARLDAAALGNFGDCKPAIYVLLGGGDKSTQARDIRRAIELARTLEERA
jgi:putative component of toxin-antitoxin plasmid stabilization module